MSDFKAMSPNIGVIKRAIRKPIRNIGQYSTYFAYAVFCINPGILPNNPVRKVVVVEKSILKKIY